VLFDLAMTSRFTFPGAEATYRGAAPATATDNPEDPAYDSIDPIALGSNDACSNHAWTPMVDISQNDGDWLKSELQNGAVRAAVRNRIRITWADPSALIISSSRLTRHPTSRLRDIVTR